MAKSQTGSCLCGAIKYQLDHDAEPIYNVVCHCLNCKKATGTHMSGQSIFLKTVRAPEPLSSPPFPPDTELHLMAYKEFKITTGKVKTYADTATDSGKCLYRNFCGDCGSPIFVTTELFELIVSIFTGTLNGASVGWIPHKEQYMETKSHWLPALDMVAKHGIEEQHARGVDTSTGSDGKIPS